MSELAVSTWSLHRELGVTYPGLGVIEGDRQPNYQYGQGTVTLLETPALVARMGIPNLEICHFHFPRTDSTYLAELRQKLADAHVTLLTLLVDTGDITASTEETRRHDMEGIQRWIDIAAEVGARRVRVIAGDTPADADGQAVLWSIEGLTALAEYGRSHGVSVITENWRPLAVGKPETLLSILDGIGGNVGLCADFGNYTGPGKYDDLKAILPRASSIHAKANYPQAGVMDREDFQRCLDLSREARFDGAYVLIFDGPGDEKTSLAEIATAVGPYL